MIWLTWRQFRGSAAVVLGALALAAVSLAITGPHLADLLRVSGEDFFDRLGGDGPRKAVFYVGTAVVYAVPAVVGAFWGAPMVAREVEAGTHRLVWNQSITRTRWLAAKLGIAVLIAAVAGSLGLLLTWWAHPLDEAVLRGYSSQGPLSSARLWPEVFGTRGMVPIGMAVLAVVIGVAAGLLIRRTVAAMAATFVAVLAVQIVMPMLVQSHLVAPDRFTTTITSSNIRGFMMSGEPDAADPQIQVEVGVDHFGAWVTENRTLGPDGETVKFLPAWAKACAPDPSADQASVDACFARVADAGYRQHVEYHPASQFWTIQWRETGLLLALTGALAGFCFWRIRRDLT